MAMAAAGASDAPPAAVSDAELALRLRAVLQTSDLSCTTERAIRKRLEEEMGADLTERKAFIRSQVEAFLLEQAPASPEDEEEEEAEQGGKGKKRKSGGGFPSQVLSEQMAAFMGAPEARRNEVVKRLWEHIKANALNSGHKIRCDDTLRGLFNQATLNMFSMNKLLGKHLFRREDLVAPADEDSEEESEGEEQAAAKKAKTAAKPKPKPKPKPKAETKAAPRPAPASAAFDPFDPFARAAKKAAKPPKAAKDPNAPKGALSPYLLFTQEERPRLLAAQPGLTFAALAKKMGERWRTLGDEERQRFDDLAVADRARAAKELAAYTAPPPGQVAVDAAAHHAAALSGRKQVALQLSALLAALLGEAQLPRGQVTKRMHAYFRDKALLDPADRRFVVADAPLRQLFGQDRFKAFAVSALLQPHLTRLAGASGGEVSEEEEEEEEEEDDDARPLNSHAPLPGDELPGVDEE